jgi:hypothetical protein
VYWYLLDSSLEVEIKKKKEVKIETQEDDNLIGVDVKIETKEDDHLMGVEVFIAEEKGRFNKFMSSLDMRIPENRLNEFVNSISTQ